MTVTATEAVTEAERGLSLRLMQELAPKHVDCYKGILTVTVRPTHSGGGWSSSCEAGVEVDVDANPSSCGCGAYIAGVIVAPPDAPRGRIYTEDETQAIVARVTGVRF